MKYVAIMVLVIFCLACFRPLQSAQPQAPVPTATRPATELSPSPMPTGIAAPASTPAPIEILSHRGYSQMGAFWIVGEIQNNTAIDVSSVTIHATLYNDAGQAIGTGTGALAVGTIPPGGTLPFTVTLGEWTDLAQYSLYVDAP